MPAAKIGQATRIYRAKVTGRRAVTIPADLCRELGIEVGDMVEFDLSYGYLKLRPAPKPLLHDDVEDDVALDDAMGVLSGCFESVEDINRYIRDGRGDWTEADEAEYQASRRAREDARLERSDDGD